MGRKTFESIGKPLPGRKNIILTSQKNYSESQILCANSLSQALQLCKNDDQVFIIGGANVYKQALDLADYIYLTTLHREVVGDSFFPQIDNNFEITSSQSIELSETVTFTIYKRSHLSKIPIHHA